MTSTLAPPWKMWPSRLTGLCFITMALAKAWTPALLATELSQSFPALSPLTPWLSRALISTEAWTGVMMMLCWKPRWILSLSTSLLFIFSLWLLTQLGISDDCGCMGAWLRLSPGWALFRNGILVLLCTRTLRSRGELSQIRLRLPHHLLIIALSLSPFAYWPSSFSELSPELRQNLEAMGLESTDTKVLLAFYSADCEHCLEGALQFETLRETSGATKAVAFIFGTADEVSSFIEQSRLQTPFQRVSAEFFYQWVQQAPPAYYLLENSRVHSFASPSPLP